MWPVSYVEEELPQDPIGQPVDEGHMLAVGDQTPTGELLPTPPSDQPGDQNVWHPDTPEWFRYLPAASLDDYLDVWRGRWNAGFPPVPDWVKHLLVGPNDPQPAVAPPASRARIEWESVSHRRQVASAWDQLRVSLPPEHAPDLVGAPDDSSVRVKAAMDGSVQIEMAAPGVEAFRSLFRGKDGALVMDNGGIEIAPHLRGAGLGLDIFVQQVTSCAAAGVHRITCMAAGEGNAGYKNGRQSAYNGYYTWPLFGYDAAIDSLQNPMKTAEIRRAFPHARTILDVFESPGGRQWWKDNGTKIPRAVFDLTPGSRSLTALRAYAEAKEAQRSRTPAPSSSPQPRPPGTPPSPAGTQFARRPARYDLTHFYPKRPREGWMFGSCGPVVQEVVRKALKAGVREFRVVDGMVGVPGMPAPVPHTWIEYPGGIIDPTREQFPPGDLAYSPEGEYRDEYSPEQFLANWDEQNGPGMYARHTHRAQAGGVAWKNKLYAGGKFVPTEYVEAQTPDGQPLAYGPEEELAGFQAAIDAEPFEGTHHDVLADWHQEMGDHEEAVFRRRIAAWLRTTPPTFREGHTRPWLIPGYLESSWHGDRANFPAGVNGVSFTDPDSELQFDWRGYPHQHLDSATVGLAHWDAEYPEDDVQPPVGFSWANYQDMMISLRESFLRWKQLQQE